MSSINLGGQSIVFDFKQDASAEGFNALLRGIVKPGVYSGGAVTYLGNTISIAAFKAVFNLTNSSGSVAISTTTAVSQTITPPYNAYLVMNYTWYDVRENWIDFEFKAVGSLLATDIILCLVTYSGSNISSIDTTVRTEGLFDSSFNMKLDTATESTSTTTGAFVLDGGVGIGKNLNVGGTINSFNFDYGTGDVATNMAIGNGTLTANTTGANNIAIGKNALAANTTGVYNTAVGSAALAANTTGINNTAVGYNALTANTTGTLNTAVGTSALDTNTTGIQNTAVGINTLTANTSGNYNTAVGVNALIANTTGASNTAIGINALAANTTGVNNTAVGNGALYSNTTATQNTAVGALSLRDNTTGTSNTAVGYSALASNNTGVQNTAVGINALSVNTTGAYNTAVGSAALAANTTGVYNIAIGTGALTTNTSGNYNTAVGVNALAANTTGVYNTAIGSTALVANTTGVQNTAIGAGALAANTTGVYNTAVGVNALLINTTGTSNTAIGVNTLDANTIGLDNTAVGYNALTANTTGVANTAIGAGALDANTIGINNTAVGLNALGANTIGLSNTAIGNGALAAGNSILLNSNTAVGNGALANCGEQVNTAIGVNAGSTITSGHNNTCLGYDSQPTAANADHQVTLGDSNVTILRCQVTTITALSDERDKTNINSLIIGLDLIKKLKPKTFNWDQRVWYKNKKSDGSKKSNIVEMNLVAQDLIKIEKEMNIEWMGLVEKGNPDRYEVSSGKLLMPLIIAVQEIAGRLETIEKKLEKI